MAGAAAGHGIMAKEAETVGVDDHRQAMSRKPDVKMLEMVSRGVGGDKERAQQRGRDY